MWDSCLIWVYEGCWFVWFFYNGLIDMGLGSDVIFVGLFCWIW